MAIIFAAALVCLLGSAGVAVDYSRKINVEGILQKAADAATLAAASDPFFSNAKATALAVRYFAANSTRLAGTPQLDVQRSSDGTRVTVYATTSIPTTLMRVMGLDSLEVGVVSVAGIDIGDLEIYAAIDMSASLGLAADATARRDLEALTSQYLQSTPSAGGCEFACHQRDGWEPGGLSSYQMAKNARIPLREDVLKSAFGSFVDSFMDPADPMVSSNHKRMAVIGFSDQAQVLADLTNQASTIKASPSQFPERLQVNTKFENAMPFIRNTIGQQGSGMKGSPKKTLLLITDGLGWERNGGGLGNGPMSGDLCDSFKQDGVEIAVIEVKYVDATGEYWFDRQVNQYYPAISSSIEACASPGLYFQAEDSDTTSLNAAFKQAADGLRTKLALKQ